MGGRFEFKTIPPLVANNLVRNSTLTPISAVGYKP
jgi:hypothetical protein